MKKFLTIALLFISASAFGQLDLVNVGTGPNSRNGDPLRTAFQKTNAAITRLNDGINSVVQQPMNSDSIPKMVFSAGMGQQGDSILFAKGSRRFGVYNNYRDTGYAINFKLIMLSTGDSLRWNCYVGNYKTNTARDSMFTASQATGLNQNYFTPNRTVTILPDESVWIGLRSDQITGKRPYEFILQMNAKLQNRKY